MFAAKAGKLELTRILLSMDHGVKSINLQDFPRGATALMHAIEQNHPSIVNLLIEREELDFEIRDLFRGQTALLIAAKYNRFEMFQMMVETGRVDGKIIFHINLGWFTHSSNYPFFFSSECSRFKGQELSSSFDCF